jgi:hypothetical protein
MRPVLYSSSFVPVPKLPRRTCLYVYFASSVLAVRISCVTAVFVSESHYLSIKLHRIYVCYMNITLYTAFGIISGFT